MKDYDLKSQKIVNTLVQKESFSFTRLAWFGVIFGMNLQLMPSGSQASPGGKQSTSWRTLANHDFSYIGDIQSSLL